MGSPFIIFGLLKIAMNFLRNLLASILGTLVGLGIFIFMFFVFMAAVGSVEDVPKVRSNSVLDLSYEGAIQDYVPGDKDDPFASFGERSVDLVDLLRAVEAAKEDDRIAGIRMNTSVFLGGWTQAEALRSALEDFRESGKFIYAYGDLYLQKDYYIASVADSVFLNPMGTIDFKGLGSEVLFFKDLQEKTGVKMEVIRHGEYKSAVEPFLSDRMSPENREQIMELLNSFWGHIAAQISESRNIPVERVNAIADGLGGRLPSEALKNKLIDGVLYQDQSDSVINTRLGKKPDARLSTITIGDYIKVASGKASSSRNKIAVLHAQGEIIYGKGDENMVGQLSFNRAIRRAVKDKNVKAIVVRVNSPGGSALTSELIWRELERARKVKPVIASFGDMATSGGYYIAAGADKIFAQPNTVTGSIGVFGVIPNMADLSEQIGVNAEQVGTHRQSVGYSLFDPMTEEFRSVLTDEIERTYDTFITRVADGRNISKEEADRIGRGRVWSGSMAKGLNLVDELGTLDDAIKAAAEASDTQEYSIVRYPRYKTGLEKLIEELNSAEARTGQKILEAELGPELYQVIKAARLAEPMEGIQARLPFQLTIE